MTFLTAKTLTEDVEGLSRLRAVLSTDPGYHARAEAAAAGLAAAEPPLPASGSRMDATPCRARLDTTGRWTRRAALTGDMVLRLALALGSRFDARPTRPAVTTRH